MGKPLRIYRAAKWIFWYVGINTVALAVAVSVTVVTQADGALRLFLLTIFGAIAVSPLVLTFRSATIVYPDAIVVRGLFRTRVTRRQDVLGFDAERDPYGSVSDRSPKERVLMTDYRRGPVQLPHLNRRDLSSWGRGFRSEVRDLENWSQHGEQATEWSQY